MNLRKLSKLARSLVNPAYWRALRAGVAPTLEHVDLLSAVEPSTVIDVGANKGQFATFAAARWPKAEIVAFEPIPTEAARFRRVLGDRATLHECALGAVEGQAVLHIASRADSSSLLPLGRQREVFGTEETSTITVPVRRLDKVLDSASSARPALLKIDVQGFEYEVLEGITMLSDVIEWVFVEVSFVELYQGQKLHGEVAQLLAGMGYSEIARSSGSRDANGVEVQADLLFQRTRG